MKQTLTYTCCALLVGCGHLGGSVKAQGVNKAGSGQTVPEQAPADLSAGRGTHAPAQGPQGLIPQKAAPGQGGAASLATADILPLGELTVPIAGVTRSCVLSLVSDGWAVTAGHCFAPAEASDLGEARPCPQGLKVRWLALNSNTLSPGQAASPCESVFNFYDGVTEATDVALLRLGSAVDTLPRLAVVFSPLLEQKQANPTITTLSPVSTGAVAAQADSFAVLGGYAFGTSQVVFAHNADHSPGMSGAPLLLSPASDWSSKGLVAIGIHLGRSLGTNRALRSEDILKFIEAARARQEAG